MEVFGKTAAGDEIQKFTLANGKSTIEVLSYGGYLRKWIFKKGNTSLDVLPGYETIADYEKDAAYMNCIVGRVCNRIANGQFVLEGKTYNLATNNGPNHLHGGVTGFNRRIWLCDDLTTNSVTLRYVSPSGEEGYPGTVAVSVRYVLTSEDALVVRLCAAVTEEASPVNLTSHLYFNLAGHCHGTIADHSLKVYAEEYHPTDNNCLSAKDSPKTVNGTKYDLQNGKELTVDLVLDNYFVLKNGPAGKPLKHAATLTCPVNGLQLDTWTTAAGVHIYTANFVDAVGKGGTHYVKRSSVAVETQAFPDAVNRPHFPSIIVQPGESYQQTVVYKLSDGLFADVKCPLQK